MNFPGFSWIFLDFHGFSWIFMDFHGFPGFFHEKKMPKYYIFFFHGKLQKSWKIFIINVRI
jgi:hypothetical protein